MSKNSGLFERPKDRKNAKQNLQPQPTPVQESFHDTSFDVNLDFDNLNLDELSAYSENVDNAAPVQITDNRPATPVADAVQPKAQPAVMQSHDFDPANAKSGTGRDWRSLSALIAIGVLVVVIVACLFTPALSGTQNTQPYTTNAPTAAPTTVDDIDLVTDAPSDEPSDEPTEPVVSPTTAADQSGNLPGLALLSSQETETAPSSDAPTATLPDDANPALITGNADDTDPTDNPTPSTAPARTDTTPGALSLISTDSYETLLYLAHHASSFTDEPDDRLYGYGTLINLLLIFFALLYVALISGYVFVCLSGRFARIGHITILISSALLAIVHTAGMVVLAKASNLFPIACLMTTLATLLIVGLSFFVHPTGNGRPTKFAYFLTLLIVVPLLLAGGALAVWNGTVDTYRPTQRDFDDTGSVATLAPGETHDPSITATPPPLSQDRKPGVYTFVLAGTDYEDYHTDVLMVATFDTINNKLNVMSISRDTQVGTTSRPRKINSSYPLGKGQNNDIPAGVNALRADLKKIMGFEPDFYFFVNLDAFVRLVDAFGGVDFEVETPMHYNDPSQGLFIDIDPGMQHLDGAHAIQVVRFRHTYFTGNEKRMEVTQKFLAAFFEQASQKITLDRLGDISDIAGRYAFSDLSRRDLLWFGEKLLKLKPDDVSFEKIQGNYDAWYKRIAYVTVYPKKMVEAVNERFNPFLRDIEVSDLETLSLDDGSKP